MKDSVIVFVHVPKTGGRAIKRTFPGLTYIGSHDRLNIECDFSFGFVRNPWDRMVSLYYYLYATYSSFRNKNPTFKDALLQDKLLMLGCNGGDDALTWLNKCNFIGRFENLYAECEIVCKLLGIPFCFKNELAKHKSSNPRPADYRCCYDDETIAFVESRHSKTISLFGYKY